MGRTKKEETEQNKDGKRHPWNEITIEPEELEQMCDEYLRKCQEGNKKPTKPGLAVHIGISVDTYDRWMTNKDGRHSKHAAVLKKAEAIISDLLQQRTDTMALFLLKQPCYGGYSDKGDNSGPQTLNVKVTFGGKSG